MLGAAVNRETEEGRVPNKLTEGEGRKGKGKELWGVEEGEEQEEQEQEEAVPSGVVWNQRRRKLRERIHLY